MISAMVLLTALVGAGPEGAFSPTFESRADLKPLGKIDELVFGHLRQLGIQPANLCSDEVFVRRVVSGRDRHAAHRPGGPGVSRRTRRQNKRARADRPAAGAATSSPTTGR